MILFFLNFKKNCLNQAHKVIFEFITQIDQNLIPEYDFG